MSHTTVLSDEHTNLQYYAPILRNFGGRTKFHGPIHTVSLFEDNVSYEEALESVAEGTVIVVDGGGSRNCALVGDRLGGIAVSRGLPGVIINGCVRDTAELAALDVGILALAPHPKKSNKEGQGMRNPIVSFGGVLWQPGFFVHADEDGVVLSERALV